MGKTGKNQDDLQDSNRAQVIRYLAMHQGCSRADLAKATGLKQASITNIMHSLLESGIVRETGFTEGLKGRRSIGLTLNYSMYHVVGVKLAWKRLTIAVFDLRGNQCDEAVNIYLGRLDSSNAEEVVEKTAAAILEFRKKYDTIIAVGMTVPGPFLRAKGAVYIPTGDGDEKVYFPFRERIAHLIDLPLTMDHDANAGALAYWWFRTNCDTRMALMYLLASEGIGGGVVAKGQIFTGQRGRSAEIGHLIVDNGGRRCFCGGHGCLNAYASSLAVETMAQERVADFPGSALATCGKITMARIFAAMRKNDELAVRLVADTGRIMGLGFASLIPIFDPDLIVIGDIMAEGGDVLLKGIDEALDESLSPFYQKPQIALADTNDDLVLLGAATIAIDYVLARPTGLLMSRAQPM